MVHVILYTHQTSAECVGSYMLGHMHQMEKADTSAKRFSRYKDWLLQNQWIFSAFRLASLFGYEML